MNDLSIRFQCPNCRARIKAPFELIGRERECPGCSRSFVVPCPIPEDSGPILVPIEVEDDYAPIRFRGEGRPARRRRSLAAKAG
jgi:hypothetical protein